MNGATQLSSYTDILAWVHIQKLVLVVITMLLVAKAAIAADEFEPINCLGYYLANNVGGATI